MRLFVGLGSHGLYFFYWYITIAISAILVRISEKEYNDIENETETGNILTIHERYKKAHTTTLHRQLKR